MTTACVYLLRIVAGVVVWHVVGQRWKEAQLTNDERKMQALEIVNR